MMDYRDACERLARWPRDDVREVELALLEAADALQARVAELEKENEWRDATLLLPDNTREVLVAYIAADCLKQQVGYVYSGDWHDVRSVRIARPVLRWRELPTPPKESG